MSINKKYKEEQLIEFLNKLDVSNNNKKNIDSLNNFHQFLLSNNYSLDLDLLIKIIKLETKLNDIIKKILTNNYEDNNDDFVSSIINVYKIYNIDDIIMESASEENITFANEQEEISNYLNQISKIPLLNEEQENILLRKASLGDIEARDILIESNQRLVVYIAKNFKNRGLPFLDLIQEGNIGLMYAIDRYDETKGKKLSTYASLWIKKTICEAIINTSPNIRLPLHVYEDLQKYCKTLEILSEKYNRLPTDLEIIKYLNISLKRINLLKQSIFSYYSMNNMYYNDEDNGEISNYISSNDESIEDRICIQDLRMQIKKISMNTILTSREQEVINLRYGFSGLPKERLEVANLLGITSERVRQLEKQALKKIREKINIDSVKDYVQSPDKVKKTIENYKIRELKKIK